MKRNKITLKGLNFYAYHGAYPSEKELGQRYEVDVEIETDLSEAAKLDDLEFSIDYTDIYLIIKKIVIEKDYNLIEKLCSVINDAIMAEYDVACVTTRVRKPQAPIGGLMSYVEVEMSKMQEKKSVAEMCDFVDK